MKLGNPTPILRIFDISKTKEFYIEFLDFSIDWEHRFECDFPLYLQVSKDNCVLHLSEHHGDCSPGAAVRIEMENLYEYHALLVDKNYKHARPDIQKMPWGSQDMSITDPFGNRLVFTETPTP